jgi:hypothetical protein
MREERSGGRGEEEKKRRRDELKRGRTGLNEPWSIADGRIAEQKEYWVHRSG